VACWYLITIVLDIYDEALVRNVVRMKQYRRVTDRLAHYEERKSNQEIVK